MRLERRVTWKRGDAKIVPHSSSTAGWRHVRTAIDLKVAKLGKLGIDGSCRERARSTIRDHRNHFGTLII